MKKEESIEKANEIIRGLRNAADDIERCKVAFVDFDEDIEGLNNLKNDVEVIGIMSEEKRKQVIFYKSYDLFLKSISSKESIIIEWINFQKEPPKESGRYWCVVEEQTDLELSKYQWNCAYNVNEKRWSDDHKNINVTYWMDLPMMPKLNNK